MWQSDLIFACCSSFLLLLPTENIFRLFFIEFFSNADVLSTVFLFSSRRELREIYTAEEDEIEYRAKKAKAKEDEERLSSSFVEWLNEHQLFESLWEGDVDGAALCQIGEEADELVKEYRNDTFAITQEVYKIGLLRYEERQNEVELFEKSLKMGKEVIQSAGHKVVNAFLEYKTGVFRKAAALYRNIERASLVEGKDQFNSHEVKEWVENVSLILY